jgi:hypothetical protein
LVKTFWGWRDQQLPDGTIIVDSFSAALTHRSACPRSLQHRHAAHQPDDTKDQPDCP